MIKDLYYNGRDFPNDKFIYRGKEYGVGTVCTKDGENYYEFIKITSKGKYLFICWTDYIGGVNIDPKDIDGYNLTIINPEQYPKLFQATRMGLFSFDIDVALIWYIIIMFVSLLFKDFLYGWIGATIIFYLWNKNK